MSLYDTLIEVLPELKTSNAFDKELVVLQDDSDGQGAYIVKWEYPAPLPEGMKVGK